MEQTYIIITKGGKNVLNRLKQLRTKANITLRDLCKYVDIRIATLSMIENGKQPMREIHVLKLTSFFDVTSDYLLGYANNGIGIYFESSNDDDDHAFISASEYERIQERYEIKETLIAHNASEFVIKNQVEETRIIRCNHSIFRSVDIPKECVPLTTSLKEQIIDELNQLDNRNLEKVLKFINEYLK